MRTNIRAFTLIELLMVVLLIGILAALAVPNLQLAGKRAKIARVQADFRTIETGLSAYHADHAAYPQGNDLGTTPTQLSSPIAYLAHAAIKDPLWTQDPADPQSSYLRYNNFTLTPYDDPYTAWHRLKYGDYLNYANSPFIQVGRTIVSNNPQISTLTKYDATNGTISAGRLIQGQRKS